MNIYTLCHQNLDIFILKTIVYNGFVNAELKGLSQNLRNRKRNSICNLAKWDRESEIGYKVNFIEKEK